MFGYFVFAAGDTVLLTFLPIYAVGIGLEEADAVRLLAVLAIGSMAFQYPIGWLADRVSNYAIVTVMSAVLLAGSIALPWALPHTMISIVFMFFYGGALGGLYTMSLVLLGRQFKGADLSAASAMLSVMFCVGAFIWPAAGGAAMDWYGTDAMPISLVAAYAMFAADRGGGMGPRSGIEEADSQRDGDAGHGHPAELNALRNVETAGFAAQRGKRGRGTQPETFTVGTTAKYGGNDLRRRGPMRPPPPFSWTTLKRH